jgi:hypothetical protein
MALYDFNADGQSVEWIITEKYIFEKLGDVSPRCKPSEFLATAKTKKPFFRTQKFRSLSHWKGTGWKTELLKPTASHRKTTTKPRNDQ